MDTPVRDTQFCAKEAHVKVKEEHRRVPIEHQPGVKVVRTNCFDCHSKCGVLAYVKDGRLMKVKGNPEDPRSRGVMCAKGLAAVQILYHPDRLNYCMLRTRPKDEADAGWRRISYQETMDLIYEKIRAYQDEFGARSIATGQGTGRGTNQWNIRLSNTIGQNHMISPGNICMGPMLASSLATLGYMPFLDGVDVAKARCYVVWGANPLWTEAGITAHRFQEFCRRGGTLIVVDPLFTMPLSHKADLWLPVRPGSDGAMVMAWIHVILNERLYQESFLKEWTNAPFLIRLDTGFLLTDADAFGHQGSDLPVVWDSAQEGPRPVGTQDADPALTGRYEVNGIPCAPALQCLKDRADQFTPDKVADVTWVPADKIRTAARLYANSSPGSAIETMQGVEETMGGVQTLRGLMVLMMLTGNLDVAGGNLWHPFWVEMVSPRLTGNPPHGSGPNRLADHPVALYPSSQPNAFWKTAISGEPYPVKMLIQVGGNPIAFNERPQLVRDALKNLEFLVVRDYFMTPTAELADLIMPAAHWTERDYIADEECGRWFYAQQKAVDPLYDRSSDLTFFRELGHRLDPDQWPWRTDEEMLDYQLEPYSITWTELKEQYCIEIVPEEYQKYASDNPRWRINTISGRFELYSTFFKILGFDPLPGHVENPETPYSSPDLALQYPLVLITGVRMPYFYHSAFRNIPWLRSMQRHPEAMINPRTAEKLGIKEGEWFVIETPHGRAKATARCTEAIHPHVVSAQHGWWQACRELRLPGYPNDEANINACITNAWCSRETYTPPMRGLLCRVYPVNKEAKDSAHEHG